MRIATCCLLLLVAGCGFFYPTDALIGAARAGDVAEMRRLLKQGHDPDVRGGVNGWPALMHAIHKNRRTSVEVLLQAGADPNARGNGGYTPLIMAAGYGYSDIVRLLLAKGADPRLTTPSGLNALTAALTGTTDIDRFTVGDCQLETVRILKAAAPELKVADGLLTKAAHAGGCKEAWDVAHSASSAWKGR
jgi:ankyrin repeat protein